MKKTKTTPTMKKKTASKSFPSRCMHCDEPQSDAPGVYDCGSDLNNTHPAGKRSKLCISYAVLREFAKSSDTLRGQLQDALEILSEKSLLSSDEATRLQCCDNPRGNLGSACNYCGGYVLADPDLGINEVLKGIWKRSKNDRHHETEAEAPLQTPPAALNTFAHHDQAPKVDPANAIFGSGACFRAGAAMIHPQVGDENEPNPKPWKFDWSGIDDLKSKVHDLEMDRAAHLTRAIERDRMRGREVAALHASFRGHRTILSIHSALIGGLSFAFGYLLTR